MPARKGKKTPHKQPDNPPSVTPTPSAVTKKRKIDWANIDQPELFEGFTLNSVTSNKRRKSGHTQAKGTSTTPNDDDVLGYVAASLSADIVQPNPFSEAALSLTQHKVEPSHVWESTKRYRKFTVDEVEFEVGQYVFIQKTPEEQDAVVAVKYWIGRILEVRAGDASHVYLRVYWLYRPEDLPGGRQPYHGQSELIASNHMDIIEAISVLDVASVTYWDEDPEKPWPSKNQLFWRQTFDLQTTRAKQLSPIRKICIDKTPCNPDEPLVQCPTCSAWLHAQCLEDGAVQDATSTYIPQAKKPATSSKNQRSRPSSSSEPPLFTAYLSTPGESGTTYLTVTDHRPKQKKRRFNVDIVCLKCNALIEPAPGDIPPEPPTTVDLAAFQDMDTESVLSGAGSPPDLVVDPSPKSKMRKRGRPRKNSLPIKDTVNEQEQAENEPEQETSVSATVADDVEEESKQQPRTPLPAAASASQSMFGSMRKMLFRGGV